MPAPLVSDVLPDLIDEMAALLREAGADPLVAQLPKLRIESVCDCGDENCSSFATASEVKNFLTWTLSAGQSKTYLERVHFIALPMSIVNLSKGQIAEIGS